VRLAGKSNRGCFDSLRSLNMTVRWGTCAFPGLKIQTWGTRVRAGAEMADGVELCFPTLRFAQNGAPISRG